jgi:RNA polymerase sigma-70 factor (ECF subfamily)
MIILIGRKVNKYVGIYHMKDDERKHQAYCEHVHFLKGLAYRMLGSYADAEDVLQDIWLQWMAVDDHIIHDRAYLCRMVTNLCLDKLKHSSRTKEEYYGVSLPEPLFDHHLIQCHPEAHTEYSQDVSLAFLLVLQRLSPLERASFLLHDVFELTFDEISQILGRTSEACRQLCSRARKNVKKNNVRRAVSEDDYLKLLNAFSDAIYHLDMGALKNILSDDVVMMSDGGGKVSAVSRPIEGKEKIAKALIAFSKSSDTPWRFYQKRLINGQLFLILFKQAQQDQIEQVIELQASKNDLARIGSIYIQRNPDKLKNIEL